MDRRLTQLGDANAALDQSGFCWWSRWRRAAHAQSSAWASRNASPALPLEDLRAFAEVHDAAKKGYVEPVEDQKLITEAIRGMVSGLDPHSAYLDPEEYQSCRSAPRE